MPDFKPAGKYEYMIEAREARMTLWTESEAKMVSMAKEAIESGEYQKAIAYLYDAKRAQAYIQKIEKYKK